jgi:predicted ester cyclase
MSIETNKALLRQLAQALEQGNWSFLEAHPGLHETRQHFPHMLAAFPDLHHTIEVEYANEEMIASVVTATGTHTGPFLGLPPTGNKVRFMVLGLERIVDGKIVHHWALPDWMGLLQQIGGAIVPATTLKPAEVGENSPFDTSNL